MLDHIPPHIGIPLSIVLFTILFVMIIRDRRRLNKALEVRPTLRYFDDSRDVWADVVPQEIFDQDEAVNYAKKDVEATASIYTPHVDNFESNITFKKDEL